jgi:hypothetical protein
LSHVADGTRCAARRAPARVRSLRQQAVVAVVIQVRIVGHSVSLSSDECRVDWVQRMLAERRRNGAVNVQSNTKVFTYHQQILDDLASHGLVPRADTPPQQLRDAVRDLYKYEIRRLRGRLIAGEIFKPDYAGHVVALRKRYWLLSIPTELWMSGP